MLYAGLAVAVSNAAYAESFTAKDFLKLNEAHQKFWIEGAIDMTALIISTGGNKTKGRCISEWYYGDQNAERNSLILASMKKYPNVPPNAIMVALIERDCGSLKAKS